MSLEQQEAKGSGLQCKECHLWVKRTIDGRCQKCEDKRNECIFDVLNAQEQTGRN